MDSTLRANLSEHLTISGMRKGVWLTTLLMIPLLVSACSEAIPTEQGILTSDGWYSVYFTDPQSTDAESFRNGPDEALAEAINAARLSVDVAAYDLNLWSIRNALLNAHQRGVSVRLVAETDNLDNVEIQQLIAEGIPLVSDRNSARMHNKFVVIDRFEVWSGSMNFTLNGAYENDNNLIRIRSSRLAEDYLAEFDEMFVDGSFSTASPATFAIPVHNIEGTQVEVYFSPEDDTDDRIIELIDRAEESIYFMAFSFTSDPIAEALLRADARGVYVAGIFETSQASNTGGEFFQMADLGLPVELDGNPKFMHHKVIIIDSRIVITGSYNFSASAEERNDENTLILHNADIAELYLAEFRRLLVDVQ
ncbi:MAG: phospholipase [Chloroflexi bacterium]|nr:phospholipase [Chloroflexota bacterium]